MEMLYNLLADDFSFDIAAQRKWTFGLEMLNFGTNFNILALLLRSQFKVELSIFV